MPLLHIQTNLSLNAKQTSDTLKTLSSQVANWLEKSENFVQIILQPKQPMTFAGTEQATAYIRWESLGFGQRSFEELCQLLCTLIHQCLGHPFGTHLYSILQGSQKSMGLKRSYI